MRHSTTVGKQTRTRRPGFSLVLSLTVMAMLLILCIGAAALLGVELRVARASVAFAKARLNAISSARIALGTLQAYAGPDKRITANAALLDMAPDTPLKTDGVNAPRLLGVWHGESVSSDYSQSHDDAFVGWLASGVTLGGTMRGPATQAYPKTAKLDAANAIRLYREPSPKPASAQGLTSLDDPAVYVAPEAVADNAGSIAWWIADDNQKADVSLRLPAESKLTPLQQAGNASPYGLKMKGDGDFAKFPESLAFSPAILDRGGIPLEPAGAPGWLADSRNFYHDITLRSSSLLTDVVNGGFKYDLSLLLAMDSLPAEYRGDTGFMGLEGHPDAPAKSTLTTRKAGWITKAIQTELKPLFADPKCTVNRFEWTCWGDLWNYARLYKHPAFDKSSGMLIDSDNDARGNNGAHNNSLDPTANVTDYQNLSPWREPVVTQVQLLLGFRTDAPDSTGKYPLKAFIRTYVQLWNPYNVPLKLTDATRKNLDALQLIFVNFPFNINIKTNSMANAIKPGYPGLFNGVGTYFYSPYIKFTNLPPADAVLMPGEVCVFSPEANSTFNSANYNGPGRDYNTSSLTPGIKPNIRGYEADAYTNYSGFGGSRIFLQKDDVLTVSFDYASGGSYSAEFHRGDLDKWTPGTVTGYDPVCRGWGRLAPGGSPSSYLLSVDGNKVEASLGQLNTAEGKYCLLFTYRLRSETLSDRRFPSFSYGDPLRSMIYAPQATNGDYRKNTDTLFNACEGVCSIVHSDEDLGAFQNPIMNADGKNGYAFTGYTPSSGISSMIREYIPLGPLGNLGDLRHARLGGGGAYARKQQNNVSHLMLAPPPAPGATTFPNNFVLNGYCVVSDAFANSFAHPMISRTEIAAPNEGTGVFPGETFFDFPWIMNSDLWDSWCVTGLAAQDSPINAFNPSGAPKTIDEVATGFFEKDKPLANTRLRLESYGASGTAMHALVVASGKPVPDGYTKSAAMMSVDGGFNINSTSVRAWRALLGGLNTATLPVIGQNTTIAAGSLPTTSGDNPVIRAPIQSGNVLADTNTGSYSKKFNDQRALAGRKLTDDQLTKLAQQIVVQVKKRGPFLSLGEFMNRRLEDSDLGNKGALQTAIDASGINNFAKNAPALQVTAADVGSLIPALKTPDAVTGPMGRGLPGYVTQADLVSPVATALTPRGDTFTIRAYGSSEEGARAAVEVVVRRTTAFMDTANDVFTFPDNRDGSFRTANKVFGRRFVVLASRWMTDDEM